MKRKASRPAPYQVPCKLVKRTTSATVIASTPATATGKRNCTLRNTSSSSSTTTTPDHPQTPRALRILRRKQNRDSTTLTFTPPPPSPKSSRKRKTTTAPSDSTSPSPSPRPHWPSWPALVPPSINSRIAEVTDSMAEICEEETSPAALEVVPRLRRLSTLPLEDEEEKEKQKEKERSPRGKVGFSRSKTASDSIQGTRKKTLSVTALESKTSSVI